MTYLIVSPKKIKAFLIIIKTYIIWALKALHLDLVLLLWRNTRLVLFHLDAFGIQKAIFFSSLMPFFGRLNHSLFSPHRDLTPEHCGFDKINFEYLMEYYSILISQNKLTLLAGKGIRIRSVNCFGINLHQDFVFKTLVEGQGQGSSSLVDEGNSNDRDLLVDDHYVFLPALSGNIIVHLDVFIEKWKAELSFISDEVVKELVY